MRPPYPVARSLVRYLWPKRKWLGDAGPEVLFKGWLRHCRYLCRFAMSDKDGALGELERFGTLPGLPSALELDYHFDRCSLANQFSLWDMMAGPLERLERLSRERGYCLGLAQAGFFRAALSINDGKYQEAIDHYLKALRSARQVGDQGLEAEILNDLGFCHRRLGDDEEGEARYLESLGIRRKSGDLAGVTESLNNLGTYYFAIKRFSEAEKYLGEALRIGLEIGDRMMTGYAYVGLGYLSYARHDYDGAERYCRQSIMARNSIGDNLGLGYCHTLMFHICFLGDRGKEALENAKLAESFFEKSGDDNSVAEARLNLVFFYNQTGATELAEKILTSMKSKYSQCETRDVQKKMTTLSTHLALKRGCGSGTEIEEYRRSPLWEDEEFHCRLIRARIHARYGEYEQAKALCLEEASKKERTDKKLDCGIAYLTWGEIAPRKGEKAVYLSKAKALFDDIRARFWARKAETALGQLQAE